MTNVLSWEIVPEQPTPALVIVSNVSPHATEKMVKDFFLFCGKIKNFEMQKSGDGESQVALVLFERESAPKTACVLSNALIMDSQITVKPYFEESGSPLSTSPEAAVHPEAAAHEEDWPLRQEEKAKASIVTELLVAGYTISDQIMERANELDSKYRVSGRVQAALNQAKAQALALDEKYKIHENLQTTAKNIDTRFHVKERAQMVEATAKTFAEQALATPTGKKFADVVIHAQSKAQQIQGDARAISEEKKRERAPGAGSEKTSPSAAAGQ